MDRISDFANSLASGGAVTKSRDGEKDTSNSISTFISSLVFNVATALLIFVLFCILRPRLRRVYAPRTYAVEEKRRPQPVGNGIFSWIPAALRVPDVDIIKQSGLDTYMFMRSIRSMFIIFSVISAISVSTMLPVNIRGTMGATGLNALSIGNVNPKSNLLWIHVGVFALSIIWVLWSIVGELRIYTHLRMWWLTSGHTTAAASTVLISDIPSSLINDDKRMHSLFDSMFPGGVNQLFVNRSSKKLKYVVDKRNKLADKLEELLTAYAVKCSKAWHRANSSEIPYTPPARPVVLKGLRIPFLNNRRMDAFEYYVSEILKCNRYILETAENMDSLTRQSSALIMFNKQIAAHMAAQTVLDYQPFSMARVSTNVNPEDIIWSNLQISPWSRRIRGYISFIITIALIVLWTVLTAILSSLVHINSLVKLKAFQWMKGNSVVMGMFSGIVPSLVLAVLMSVLPVVLRLLLRVEGTARKSEIELRLLHRYYFFQIWNIYLVSIFSSSVFQIAVKSIGEPGRIVELIQTQVPQSATNILTYVLLLAFLGAAKELLQGMRLALRYIMPLLLANTPRNICRAEIPAEFDWGTNIPTHSLIFVMGFSYSFIAPIVNCFVAVYFGLFYLIYRYQFLYVYNDTNWTTGGLSFPKSVKQMLVGIYISEVYLLLLMVAKLHNGANAIMRVVVAVGIIVFTIGAHLYIDDVYMPAIKYLPVKKAADVERNPLLAQEFPNVLDGSGDIEANMDSQQSKESTADFFAWDLHRKRNRIYAMYSSLVPSFAINLVLRVFPSLLCSDSTTTYPSINNSSCQDTLTESDINTSYNIKSQKQSVESQGCNWRASKLEWKPIDLNCNSELECEFACPELRAQPVCILWVPLGNSQLFAQLVNEIEQHGQGTILVISQGANINLKHRVTVDIEFPNKSIKVCSV
ncbi:DUF221-domain-containing protein [Coemansia reversa NRRL 1564]|uniref:DUF221-domain-containing protein n=1 Tax=Coemansia reversa (strain ATCC 12441 / NRRL 1564) TaxID=763665 RepID=A0A2G5BAJ0_COERN|nr:DUF221-domain-containing protein [Coemansia reversa NRRL 1564]|eukprot:PIA15737.1 DUF221-domain-containing protein [Coemansia reversa NRRL 1564]